MKSELLNIIFLYCFLPFVAVAGLFMSILLSIMLSDLIGDIKQDLKRRRSKHGKDKKD